MVISEITINDLLSQMKRRKHIPTQVREYVRRLSKSENSEPLLQKLLSTDGPDCLDRLDRLFERACRILEITPSQLAKTFGFHGGSEGTRIESFLAELRTVAFLDQNGFTGIVPLDCAQTPRADFIATRNMTRYAVEVFCSLRQKYMYPDHVFRCNDLERYFVDRATKKKIQIDSILHKKQCERGMLVLVLNSHGALELLDHGQFISILRNVSNQLTWGPDYFFALVTGMELLGGVLDDAIYPMLESPG